MLFRRRTSQSLAQRLRTAVWPRHSWSRSARYFTKRILRLSGSPHAVAAGVAAGVFASFTPFIGFHFIIAFVLAFAIGGNLLAAGLGTFFGNPLTFPFIWASTFTVGSAILHQPGHFEALHQGFAERSLEALWPLIAPMTVGALPLGLPVAAVFYALGFFGVRAFRDMRRERLEARRREREESQALGEIPPVMENMDQT
jgi:uncharacterized protein (DUF2062 family)